MSYNCSCLPAWWCLLPTRPWERGARAQSGSARGGMGAPGWDLKFCHGRHHPSQKGHQRCGEPGVTSPSGLPHEDAPVRPGSEKGSVFPKKEEGATLERTVCLGWGYACPSPLVPPPHRPVLGSPKVARPSQSHFLRSALMGIPEHSVPVQWPESRKKTSLFLKFWNRRAQMAPSG